MANDDVKDLVSRRAADVLRDTDRKSVGVVRILSDSAGTPGDVREYESGDEALVEAGQAEWIVAPVHSPEAGRRLDTDAEREPHPRGGVEGFPPADGDPQREAEARRKGYVDAYIDEGAGEKLAAKRAEVAKGARESGRGDDVREQLKVANLSARSGPVTAEGSDLTPNKLLEDAGVDTSGEVQADRSAETKPARVKSTKE